MKKLLSLLLCFALLLSLTPAAFADDETPEEAAPVEEELEEAPAEEAAPTPEETPEEEAPAPAEEPPAAPADEPASEEENEKEEPDDTDDGPEYGVQPAEEKTEDEEAPQEDEQTEDEEAPIEEISVLVRFSCDPRDAAVTVYEGTQRADGSWVKIGAASEGKCTLSNWLTAASTNSGSLVSMPASKLRRFPLFIPMPAPVKFAEPM